MTPKRGLACFFFFLLGLVLLLASLAVIGLVWLLFDQTTVGGVGSDYAGPLAAGLTLLGCIRLTALFWRKKPGYRKFLWFIRIPALICLLALAGDYAYRRWWTSQPAVEEYPNAAAEGDPYYPYDFFPFTSHYSPPELTSAPTLRLAAPWPRLAGATALLPIYGAVISTVFPEEAVAESESLDQGAFQYHNGTREAYNMLIAGDLDVIFVAGPSAEQRRQAKEMGVELRLTPIGREAFVFFVNKSNSVNNLGQEQIRSIYSGHVTNWRKLGGSFSPIIAFQRNRNSGSQSAMERFMGETPLVRASLERVPGDMFGLTAEIAQYRNHGGAIGYSFRYYLENMAANPGIKILQIDGVPPTPETILNGTYPLASAFYAITAYPIAGNDKRDPALLENMEKLLQWLQSPQGQELVEKIGYVRKIIK